MFLQVSYAEYVFTSYEPYNLFQLLDLHFLELTSTPNALKPISKAWRKSKQTVSGSEEESRSISWTENLPLHKTQVL